MLEFGGIGHSMVIHSSDSEVILKFGLEKPAFRILVNTQAALGAVGYTNELAPSMTLGPGTFGGSIVSENVTAKHLINIKKLAFETRPIHPPEQFLGKTVHTQAKGVPSTHARAIAPTGKSWLDEIDERIRPKAGNAPVAASPSTSAPAKSPAPTVPAPGPTNDGRGGHAGAGGENTEDLRVVV